MVVKTNCNAADSFCMHYFTIRGKFSPDTGKFMNMAYQTSLVTSMDNHGEYVHGIWLDFDWQLD